MSKNTTTPAPATKSKKTAAAAVVAPVKRTYTKSAEYFEIEGCEIGGKIKFELEGKMVTGTLRQCKASNRHPNGRAYIEYKGQIVKRSLNAIEVPAQPVKSKANPA